MRLPEEESCLWLEEVVAQSSEKGSALEGAEALQAGAMLPAAAVPSVAADLHGAVRGPPASHFLTSPRPAYSGRTKLVKPRLDFICLCSNHRWANKYALCRDHVKKHDRIGRIE